MRLSEVERMAKDKGIKNTWGYSKKRLIKAIQRQEGNFACFATARGGCSQSNCCWKDDCLR